MKVIKSSPITSFGGLNFVLKEMDERGIGALLERELPELPTQCRYNWRDLLYSFWSVFFCGGDHIEDLAINIKGGFGNNPMLSFPSPDRLLERMKELACPKDLVRTSRSNLYHEFSSHDLLNSLNLKMLKNMGMLEERELVLDFDHTLIFTDKADARMSYQKQRGYNPGVGLVNGKVVYLENRNGNSGAHILQEYTLERMFQMLSKEQIKISTFRADSASFSYEGINVINRFVDKFYIRPQRSQAMARAISKIDQWTPIETPDGTAYIGEASFTPFERTAIRKKQADKLREYRLVVTKEKRLDGQIDIFTKDAYCYWGILTNDPEMTATEVIEFYAQRGAAEKEFDILKHDFGWKHLPFSKLEQNTVFLIFSAMCRNIYAYMIELFSKTSKVLRPHYRLKKFIFRFICIPAKWIRRARGWHLRLYGEVAFKT